MPEFLEIVCDNCEVTHRREKHDEEPSGWYIDGWVICPKCWTMLKSAIAPAVEEVLEKMPNLFSHLSEPQKKPKVAMSLLVNALEELRRLIQPESSCVGDSTEV